MAYKQYLPVRETGRSAGEYELYRTFTYGDMATIVLPETRLVPRGILGTEEDSRAAWVRSHTWGRGQ